MVNKFIIKSARASRRIRPNKGRILQFDACPSFRVGIKYLFRFLSLLFFFRSIAHFFASKRPVIKKTKKIDAVMACKIF